MPIIKFVKENKEIEVPEGAILRKEAKKAGINLNQGLCGVSDKIDTFCSAVNKHVNCHGMGMCGTCRVLITSGADNVNAMTMREKMKFKYLPVPDPLPALAYIGNEDTMRLACMTKVNGDIEVQSGPPINLFGDNFFS